MNYRVHAIERSVLKELLVLDDAGREPEFLVERGEGGSPLRCCLMKSEPGDELALVSYAPLRRWATATAANPGAYDEQGPIFIHATECNGPSDGFPLDLHARPRVFRAYDANGRILGGLVVPAGEHENALEKLFLDNRTTLIQVRAVEYGCFTFAITRA